MGGEGGASGEGTTMMVARHQNSVGSGNYVHGTIRTSRLLELPSVGMQNEELFELGIKFTKQEDKINLKDMPLISLAAFTMSATS